MDQAGQFSPDGDRLAVGCLVGGTTVFDAAPVNQAFRRRELAAPPWVR